jgi:hypothetical protein
MIGHGPLYPAEDLEPGGNAMQVRRIKDGPERIYAVVFQTGDDPIEGLKTVARDEGLAGSSVTAIGAFRRAVLGFFDFDRRDRRVAQIHKIVTDEILLKQCVSLRVILRRSLDWTKC